MKDIKRLTATLTLLVLTSLSGYTQSSYPKLILQGSDTLVVYEIDQVRYQTKLNEKNAEMIAERDTLLSVCNGQLMYRDSIIQVCDSSNYEKAAQIEHYKKLGELHEDEIDNLEQQRDLWKKQYRIQRFWKWVGVVYGSVTMILYIAK